MKPDIPMEAAGARGAALSVLLACRRRDVVIQEALDRTIARVSLSDLDRRLVTQLAYGVLRRRGTLDALLAPLIARPLHRVEPFLWEALRIGVYQLLFLTHIPPHAAVHESVELAASSGRPKAKGFLNAILRGIERLATCDWTDAPASDALPVESGRYRRLTRPALPEPATNQVEYLASAFSFPDWLAARWLSRYSWEECLRLGFWFAGPAPLWLRCNSLRATRDRVLAAFAEAGIGASPGNHPQGIRVNDHAAVRDLPGFAEGWFTVQDESAMAVGTALAPTPGASVLDCCAAPGGKTTHLAELMENRGAISACDVADHRLRLVEEQCRRLGVTIVQTRRLRTDRNDEPPQGPFDAVLVDVPCSNTGVLGRRPEARWRLRPDTLERLVPLQTKLLIQAAERLRPGGVLVYSTCSIEPQENGEVVRTVHGTLRDLMFEAEEEQAPGRAADGGYWARLYRRRVAGS